MSPDIVIRTDSHIKTRIHNKLSKCGGSYSSWYIGISQDPRYRLFTGHKVREDDDWIIEYAFGEVDARSVEKYFINLGMNGASGGGDEDATAVYAYKKTSHSEP